MTQEYTVPVRMRVPAHAQVEIEANSLEEACIRLRDDIDENGMITIASTPDFTADWENADELAVGDVVLPDGRMFSTST